MRILKELKPQPLFDYFENICQVPRPSGKEEKIRKFLLEFAKKQGLEAKTDKTGNLLISKPAYPGREDSPVVILQTHMDMVCEKNSDKKFDFDHDPIEPVVADGRIKANGTTLGADCGIGMAAQMAVLTSKEIKHGPVECLFTVEEETGLTGAFGLQPGFMTGSVLLNLDSEDEGEIFIGCAGGIDTIVSFEQKTQAVPGNSVPLKLAVSGLLGGHSGDDIHKNRGNAIKILNRFLWKASRKFSMGLSDFDGGNLRNAIAREASAVVVVPEDRKEDFLEAWDQYVQQLQIEYQHNEPRLKLKAENAALPEHILQSGLQNNLINALYACPHGILEMSTRMEGMVETSTNLASVKFTGNDSILITTSQRSELESRKHFAAEMIRSVFELAGAGVNHSGGYPGWTPNPDSKILHTTVESYKKLFGTAPVVRSIHAGLECGLFLKKYPHLDMVSFGPTIKAAHSPDEWLDIETTEKFWKHLVDVLKNIKPLLLLFIFCFNALAVFSQNYSWQKPHAKVLPNGDLQWEPKSFNYTPGSSVLYIDYESGNDNNLGTDKSSPWKHHPWDPDATGNADASSGIHTYVFKKGVIYRGKLIAEESGDASEPVRLTSDPSWGTGEACIYASERITGGWQQCTTNEAPQIPNPEMVWYKDVGSMIPYKTEMVCEITDDEFTRVNVARSPNWTITDKNFPMKNWWIIDDTEGDWIVDNKHFTQSDPDYWDGATIWTQWGDANMATPVRGEVTDFDPDNNRVKANSRADKDCYYYIENLPQLLDQPNEFYYNKENSRLFIRLKGDRNPNHSVIEVGVRGKNIVIEDKHHIEISGLSFAFNNIPNEKSYGHHTVQETNEVFIRIEGECHSIEVSNCKFRYVVDGIGVHNENDPLHVMHDIRITDNDFAYVDDQAVTFGNYDCNYFDFYPDNEKAYSVIRDVSILRNKVYYSGSRQTSGFWSQIPAIGFGYFQSGEIAGNILDYCWGSGINVYWGKSVGSDATVNAVPYIRGLIHHNKVTNSMLVNNDYGGIESWGGGPAYIYNNISENARGNRNYGVDKDWGVEWTPFGMAFYIDHAYKHYLFNNIAIGLHNSLEDATQRNAIAFQHVKGFLNLFANNTAYKFTKPFSSMGNGAQRVFYLGNVLEDITYKYFHTGHDDKSDIPYMSYSNNIFVGDPEKFGRYVTGPYSHTLNQFRTNLSNDQAQVSQTGWNASGSVMIDPDKRDFRPLQGGDATDRGVKFFSPWGLYAVVGEWCFYKHTADSSIIMGENFYLGADGVSGEQDNYPKNNLNVVGVSYDDYVYGKLEDWTEGALQFDGANTYCYIDDSESDQYVRTDLDADINNFLIEVYMRTEMSHTGGVLVAKHDKSSNGYALDIDETGHARLKIITGGTEAFTLKSNTAVNDSNWHHILAEVDRIKGEAQIYIDGAEDNGDGSGAVPGPAVSLSNSADFLAGKDVNENYFAGMIDFLRISKGTLADAHTSIGELYAWEMDGPFTKDFAGNSPDSLRDAGALEYADLPDSLHYLTVNNGMGDGYYPEGAEVRIYGDGPPADSVFAAWTGDNSYVTDPQKLFTTVSMPDKDITIEAAYADTKKYTLTVKRGSSSGQYPAGKTIEITADQSPRDSIFKKWSGDTFAIMNISMANSYVVMPAKDITIEACYSGAVLSETYSVHLKVYPNPVNNILTIENVKDADNIQIMDITGSPIIRKSIHSSTISLNVSDLSNGIYILQIDTDGRVITRKLIVKK